MTTTMLKIYFNGNVCVVLEALANQWFKMVENTFQIAFNNDKRIQINRTNESWSIKKGFSVVIEISSESCLFD